ncbi:hypothetical protein H632_c2260p0, partial [Helicosporidium sp. ATCC 50920]
HCLNMVCENPALMSECYGMVAFNVEKTSSRGAAPRNASRRRSPTRPVFVGAVALLCLWALASSPGSPLSSRRGLGSLAALSGRARTLVVYVYSLTDEEYERNLLFFLEHGVSEDDGVDYVLVIQEGGGVIRPTHLPALPPNVRVLKHPNSCFDWGTFGWVSTSQVDVSGYQYLVLLNSSVRGPFVPAYWPKELHWTQVLTQRLSDEVKMVGATISCEASWKGGVLSGEKRQNPHVQSYLLAMDQEAYQIIKEDGAALRCYDKYHDAVWYAEMGSSAAVLRSGHNIDALMLRYQGVDWRDTSVWGCNAALNPYAEHMNDGIDVSPLEVMFVKIKEYLLEANWTTAATAVKYSQWADAHRLTAELVGNEYLAKKQELRQGKVASMRRRGPACFDFEFYKARNPDLPSPPWGPAHLWEHFVEHGQHEGRVFRF